MKKIGKLLAFIGVSGAALAGLWYFIDVTKKTRECEEECAADEEEQEEEVETESRSYVNLNDTEASEADKEALKKTVASAVSESIAKAEEAAEGIGIVKEEKDASDFSFESFDAEN